MEPDISSKSTNRIQINEFVQNKYISNATLLLIQDFMGILSRAQINGA